MQYHKITFRAFLIFGSFFILPSCKTLRPELTQTVTNDVAAEKAILGCWNNVVMAKGGGLGTPGLLPHGTEICFKSDNTGTLMAYWGDEGFGKDLEWHIRDGKMQLKGDRGEGWLFAAENATCQLKLTDKKFKLEECDSRYVDSYAGNKLEFELNKPIDTRKVAGAVISQ